MSRIKPTVGRVVWYYPPQAGFTGCHPGQGVPLPAMIAKVWSDDCINIGGFDANGMPFNAASVMLFHDDGASLRPGYSYAEWMPYQKGQAAKVDAIQAVLAKSE